MSLEDAINDTLNNHIYPLFYKIILLMIITLIAIIIVRLGWHVFFKLWRSGLSIAKTDKAEGIILGKYWKWRLFSPTRAEAHIAVLGDLDPARLPALGSLRSANGRETSLPSISLVILPTPSATMYQRSSIRRSNPDR